MKTNFDISDFINVRTIESATADLISRIKLRRKEAKISQSKLSTLSGVSFGSIRRFEETGEISLKSLIRIANALDYIEDFDLLFKRKKLINLKDYINAT